MLVAQRLRVLIDNAWVEWVAGLRMKFRRNGLCRRHHVALMRQQKGVTIIELMVTVTIMALLMAAVAPGMTEWVANMRLRGSAEVALAGLQKARAEAIKQNQVITFWLVSPATAEPLDDTCALSSTSASWVISTDDPSGACSVAPSLTTAPRIVEARGAGAGASGIVIAAVDTAGNAATSVAFNAYGQMVNPAAAIQTIDFTSPTSGTRRLRMQISTEGGVHLCDRDVATTDPRSC